MHLVVLGLLAEHVRVGSAELGLVEAVSEFLLALSYFLGYLLLDLSEIILDKVICTVSLLGVFIIDKRVVESGYVAGSDPGLRMHENAGIDADYVLVETSHGFPPISLYVVFEFYTHLAVIINGGKSIINLAGREYETIFLAMCDKNLEKFFLCHSIYLFFIFFRLICKNNHLKLNISGNEAITSLSAIWHSGTITKSLSRMSLCGTVRRSVSILSVP